MSLSPAISRTLVDLGLDGLVVGRTPWCRSLDQAIPVAGSLTEIDFERLVDLRPSHVLVQPRASGVEPALAAMAEREGWTLGVWRLDTLEDIRRMVRELPATVFDEAGSASERGARAGARARAIDAGFETALRPPERTGWSGSTLLVASVEPVPLVYGRETYLHEILVALGARNAVADRGWSEKSIEDIVRIDPEAIIVVRDRGAAGTSPAEAAGPLAGLDIRATRAGRLGLLQHEDAELPSSALVQVAETMRRVLFELGAEPGVAPGFELGRGGTGASSP